MARLTAIVFGAASSAVAAVSDDFLDMNDTANPAWIHLDGAVASTGQTWNASTGSYRMTAPNNSEAGALAGLGFVGSYVCPEYTDVRVTADIVDHPNTPFGGFFGVAARLNGDNGLPVEGEGIKLLGYSYQYEAHARGGLGEMVLNVLLGDGFKDIGSDPVSLDVTKVYRFVLEVNGNVLHGQTYELDVNGQVVGLVGEKIRDLDAEPVGDIDHDADPSTPDQPFVPYTRGHSGVYAVGSILIPGVDAADVTIDNFKTESLTLAADFNGDRVVDGADLDVWKGAFGVDGSADADEDCDSDGDDFLVWQQQLGMTAPLPAISAVPEPAVLHLVGIAAVAVLRGGGAQVWLVDSKLGASFPSRCPGEPCGRNGDAPDNATHWLAATRFYPRRTAGGHCNHWRFDRVAIAGSSGRPRSSPPAQCINNLRQFGVALHNYHTAKNAFPPGAVMTKSPTQVYANANTVLLPYFEQAALASLYDHTEPWEGQRPGVAATVIAIFKCPSSGAPNPVVDPLLATVVDDTVYGTSEYAFCMGYTDAFCAREGVKPGEIPHSQQGMFNIAWGPAIRQITDGTSNTIALGMPAATPVGKSAISPTARSRILVPDPSGAIAHGGCRLDHRRA